MKKAATSWTEDVLARQKLVSLGPSALGDAQLLGIVLGSGTIERSATEIASDLLRGHRNSLAGIGRSPAPVLRRTKGMDPDKAARVMAALELGRRMKVCEVSAIESIAGSEDIASIFRPLLGRLSHEEVWALYLTSSHRIIERIRVSHGGVGSAPFDPRIILKRAVELLCPAIALVHNHPSGDPLPSEQDLECTRRIRKAAALFDIRLVDHVIVTDSSYFSFAGHNLLG